MNRPHWLPYRAKDGVLETHFTASDGLRGFSNFVEKALRWAEGENGSFRLLDTFFSDSVTPEILELLFSHASKDSPVHILLVDPRCDYAHARAESICQDVMLQTQTGLSYIAEAMNNTASLRLHTSTEISAILGGDIETLVSYIHAQSKARSIYLDFYSTVPSGPLYFFKDILLCGRFCAGRSAIRLPWSMVVKDPGCNGDLYDVLSDEFEYIKSVSYKYPGQRASGNYKIFLSYAEQDSQLATDIREDLSTLEGVECFMACHDLAPGDRWKEKIQSELSCSNEIIALLTPHSISRPWIHAEMGAAWVLGKTITPAITFVAIDTIPSFIGDRQAVTITSAGGRAKLLEVIARRAISIRSVVPEDLSE